ncbi:MAG TPA: hypothetical protein PKL77_11240 [Candidatus Omnitrophota bacterium]|nr:hypothetical protein [Candidatus Omnitrophota bacterium]
MKLWVLTEERPKKNVLRLILERYCADNRSQISFSGLLIKPEISNNRFSFTYQVSGFASPLIQEITIKLVSGNQSFVDFLVFAQDAEPAANSEPIYAIEETKTTDEESRNTGVYQRGSKFVYIDLFYPNVKKIMLYNYQVPHSPSHSTDTNIFGTRMLLTLGVEIIGRNLDPNTFKPFTSVDELISFKNSMRRPPRGNTPILINKSSSLITVSGRLDKPQAPHTIIHDPNMGALSLILKSIRKLGWTNNMSVTQHNINQRGVRANKFVAILNLLHVGMDGLTIPQNIPSQTYWYYENSSEKIATIFTHLICESLPGTECIYENHAGCERGYFKKADGTFVALPKKDSNDEPLRIPDLIVCNHTIKEILLIEGKKIRNLQNGLDELNNYDPIENEWINPQYPEYQIKRYVVIFGGSSNITNIDKLALVLSDRGDIFTSQNTPQTIHNALAALRTA